MKTRLLTVSSIYAHEKRVPAIRICGNWLVKNGFQTGQKVMVDEKPGSLTITLILEENEQDVGKNNTKKSTKINHKEYPLTMH